MERFVTKGEFDVAIEDAASGIGTAKPWDTPVPGIKIYNVSTAGIYTEFLKLGGTAVEVTAADLTGGLVSLRMVDANWEKVITALPLEGYVQRDQSPTGYYGPYESLAAACLAIPNEEVILGGILTNFRSNKIVGIRTNLGLTDYFWKNGYDDSDLTMKETVNTVNTFAVFDWQRQILSASDLTSGGKIQRSTGVFLVDANFSSTDFINVELGDYEIKGYFDAGQGGAGYNEFNQPILFFTFPTNGIQTFSFSITNPLVTKIRLSTHSSGVSQFYLKKTSDSLAKNRASKELDFATKSDANSKLPAINYDKNPYSKYEVYISLNAANLAVIGESRRNKIIGIMTSDGIIPYKWDEGILDTDLKLHYYGNVRSVDITPAMIEGGFISRGNGNLVPFIDRYYFDYIEANPDVIYTTRTFISSSSTYTGYDENYVRVADYVNTDGGVYRGSFSFQVAPAVKYLRGSCTGADLAFFKLSYKAVVFNNEAKATIKKLALEAAKGYIAKAVFYVDQITGNDDNDGSSIKPFKTISRSILSVLRGGIIIVKSGDYFETLTLTALIEGDVTIQSYAFDKVRIMGSDVINGFSLVSGTTKVYVADFSGTIALTGDSENYGYRIFDDLTPSKLIPTNEVHALQNSQTHRLPFSDIIQITNKGNLQANIDFLNALNIGLSGYWYDQSNGKIYVVIASELAPASNQIHYANRLVLDSIVTSNKIKQAVNLTLQGLQFFYSNNKGVCTYAFQKVNLWSIRSFGHRLTGVDDQSSHSHIEHLETGGNGTDGYGNSLYFVPPNDGREKEKWQTAKNVWSHDNYDDGFSTHQNGSSSIDGFLIEYNGDCGIQHVGASYGLVRNGLIRKSGTNGLMVNANPLASNNRKGSVIDAHNVLVENSGQANFRATTGSVPDIEGVAILNLFNCISRKGTSGFRSDGMGIINANNCLNSGNTTLKIGSISVINDNILV